MAADIFFEQILQASVEQIYRAFTNATALREWLCDTATTDPRPKGRILLGWNSGYFSSGSFSRLDENAAVEFSWLGRDDPAATQVALGMLPQGNSATRLTLRHSGFNDDAGSQAARREIELGWAKGLRNLVSVLESGPDLRIVEKPMLGLVIGDLTPHKAAQLGFPVKEGIRLDSVLEGMGAQRAGLQKDDLVVAMDGSAVSGYPDLGAHIAAHRAGDIVEVEFYRGPEKHKVKMELSRRALPGIPETPAQLAAVLAQTYAGLDETLEALLAPLSHEKQEFRPGPEEWNIREILAHLIHSERDIQSWLNDFVCSQERLADGYSESLLARVRATVQAFPSAAELFQELKRAEAETLGFIAELPSSFTARKSSYWKMAFQLLQPPYHSNDHIAQIQANLTAYHSS